MKFDIKNKLNKLFTFHFDSIKTIFEPDAATLSSIFTFHFDSIKT